MTFVLEEKEKIKASIFGKVLPSEQIGEDEEIPCRLALTDLELVLYKFRDDYFEETDANVIVKKYQFWKIEDILCAHIAMSRVSLFSKKIIIAIYTEFEKVSIVCEKEEFKECAALKSLLKKIKGFKFFT
ncbi:MAG: hypothetical protein RR348_00515 [Clostridia bacterium]